MYIYTFVAALRVELGISPSRGFYQLCLIATRILVTSIQTSRSKRLRLRRMLARHNIDMQR